MHRKLFILPLLAILVAASPFLAATTKYETDVNHSNIGFSIPIMGGLSHVRGKFTDFKVSMTTRTSLSRR